MRNEDTMPDWLLALLLVLGSAVLAGVGGFVVFRAVFAELYRRDLG